MKKLILSSISYILCLSLILTQLNLITAVSAEGNPITSAITAAINNATNQNPATVSQPPMTAPIPNPITSPISQPITAPVTNEPAATLVAVATNPKNVAVSPKNVLQPVDPKYGSQAPVCTDAKPGSAPKIISAISAEPNTVTLTWAGAGDPVTYYLIAYGEKSGQMKYGNPNAGGKDTRSYKIKGLSGGQIYYLKVRAGNNCMPGEFSNELAAEATGPKTNSKIADNFAAGVLSNTKDTSSDLNLPFKPITSVDPARFVTASGELLAKILDFIKNLFYG